MVKKKDSDLKDLEKMVEDIKAFKKTPVYLHFEAKVKEWLADEYRIGWECKETKPPDMKLAQASWHTLNKVRRIFELPEQELKSHLEERKLENLNKPLLAAADGEDEGF